MPAQFLKVQRLILSENCWGMNLRISFWQGKIYFKEIKYHCSNHSTTSIGLIQMGE